MKAVVAAALAQAVFTTDDTVFSDSSGEHVTILERAIVPSLDKLRSQVGRFYFDIEGTDDEALRMGFAWMAREAKGSGGVIAVPGLKSVDNLPPRITPDQARDSVATKASCLAAQALS